MSNVNFKIVDIFESVKDDIFSIQPYLSINNNLKNHDIENFPEIFDYSFESIESIEMYAQAFIDEILRVSKEPISTSQMILLATKPAI